MMFQKGYVQLQEVPKSADRHPTRTFYLWSVDLAELVKLFTQETYKTTKNLTLRLQHQIDGTVPHSPTENADLIAKAQDEESGAQVLTEAEREHLDWLQKAGTRLGSAIGHLIETLLVLERFNFQFPVEEDVF